MSNKLFLILFSSILAGCQILNAQDDLSLGIQFKPIIPSNITNSGSFEFTEDFVRINVDPSFGYSWGVVVRKRISDKISFETGISSVTRNFKFQLTDLDSAFTTRTKVGIVNYEIPLCGLIYIQLGDQFYMNNSLGISFDMPASDVESFGDEFSQITYYRKWIQPALKANVGFEYRTEKSGYLYLGITFHNPFKNIAVTELRYRKNQIINTFVTELNGAYLTADLRYFFHPKKD